MRTVWKFPFAFQPGRSDCIIEMPEGAQILTAAFQGPNLCLWALCETSSKREDRRFQIVGTGHQEVSEAHSYITTVYDGPYVWHLFEAPRG